MSLFDKASLVVTPNGVKEGKLYSIKPTDGSGDLNVVRATSATRVDANGLVEIPRTNLLTYSNDFTNWIGSGYITANYDISPDGTQNASRCLFTGANQILSRSSTLSTGVDCSATIYIKGTSGETIQLAAGGVDKKHTLNGSWQRIETNATSINSTILLNTFGGATARDLLIYGAQLEQGVSATEYIPTTSSIRTKFAGITQDGSSASNILRLDYTNGSCPSILVEPQRTNFITYSEDFTQWSKIGGVVVTNNFAISPDGTQNASKLVYNGTTSGRIELSTSASGTVTQSVYLKTESGTQAVSIGASSGSLLEVTVTNEWQRFEFTGSGNFPRVLCNDVATIYAWGAQLEEGSYATSYIPTVASTVTRNADVISKTGISDLIGQTEGTVFLDANISTRSNTRFLLDLQDGTNNDVFQFVLNGNTLTVNIFDSGILQASLNGGFCLGRKKIALGYKLNDFVLYVDGVQISTDTSGTIPTTSLIALGHLNISSGYELGDSINSTALWKTRLDNATLAQLTTL